MLGVENLKKVLGALVAVAVKVDEVTQDGFQVLADSLALVPSVFDVVMLIKSGKDAWAEFQDLDETEKAEVLAFMKEKFDIEDEELEVVVEEAFDVIAVVADFVVDVRNALKK